MLARIAHELFWLGRNVSRAEHTARLIDGVFQADIQGSHDDPAGVTLSWDAVLAIMGSTAALRYAGEARVADRSDGCLAARIIYDEKVPTSYYRRSIRSAIHRRGAR